MLHFDEGKKEARRSKKGQMPCRCLMALIKCQSSSSFSMCTQKARDTESICINEILMDSDAFACVAGPLTTIGAIMCSTLLFELLAVPFSFPFLMSFVCSNRRHFDLIYHTGCPKTFRPRVNTDTVVRLFVFTVNELKKDSVTAEMTEL